MTQPDACQQKLALSVADFCAAFSIGRSTFYEEVKAGRLRVLKAGRRTLVASAEAERWLRGLKGG
jgi:excisionase family DNA binding protein